MIIVIGLVILVAAVVVGVTGVLSNGGSGHAITHFAVFGYHVTGSTGSLFLYGIVVGALGLLGLSLLLAGARRASRRRRAARRSLRQSRRETAAAVSQDRDDLISQREAARAHTASTLSNSPAEGDRQPGEDGGGQRSIRHLFGHRAGAPPAQAADGQPASDIPAGDVPAGASAPAE
jgi:uncharacterized membrane protein YccC